MTVILNIFPNCKIKKGGGKNYEKKFEEVKDVLKVNMKNTVVNNNTSKFAQKLKSKATVEINEELLAKYIHQMVYN